MRLPYNFFRSPNCSLYEQEKQASNIRLLINALGCNQAHIIGYSSGAWLAAGLVKYHPNILSSLVIGGWDVENGLPEGPNGKLDFDTFFAYAKITAPELTDWITSDTEPAVRAYFDAISSYDGFYDSERLTQINIPKLFWAGLEDVYYQQLNFWAEANKYAFISATGDHVGAILKPERSAPMGRARQRCYLNRLLAPVSPQRRCRLTARPAARWDMSHRRVDTRIK
ncbi:alpha/beta hydrolase (plasmid) [Serratia sp. AXJ-M]|uniref:alpha/beta fold hydrolase n=1 Tax=Serratia sp. AXJ-M TaxID=2754727 RepID=UPI00397B205B